jgi:hypothetical protein
MSRKARTCLVDSIRWVCGGSEIFSPAAVTFPPSGGSTEGGEGGCAEAMAQKGQLGEWGSGLDGWAAIGFVFPAMDGDIHHIYHELTIIPIYASSFV